MKRTKIKYRNMADGRVMIIGVENRASFQEIETAFGREICQVYQNGYPRYDTQLVQLSNVKSLYCYNGYIVTKEYFQDIISTMKAAGARLRAIAKFTTDAETKEVLI